MSEDKEIILEIIEKDFDRTELSWSGMSGFVVKTTKQEIKLAIDNYQSCCESWGYLMSEDDLSRFIGAELREIRISDHELKPLPVEINTSYGGGVMFVTFITDRGAFQFVAYNEHNGYYSHDAVVESIQLHHEESL